MSMATARRGIGAYAGMRLSSDPGTLDHVAVDIHESASGQRTMGNRLTKIYTRTGDDGTTGLGTGERVAKDCPRVEAYGTVDELNCLHRHGPRDSQTCQRLIRHSLTEIQHRLFDLGGELAVPGRDVILATDRRAWSPCWTQLNADLPPLKDFVLPGGTPGACRLPPGPGRLPPGRTPGDHAA